MATNSAVAAIRPGEDIIDQNGRVAQLHGLGILPHGGRFWAWGEDKSAGGTFTSVESYSTEDFIVWRHEGRSLEASEQGHTDLRPGRVVERPKVLENPETGLFMMFLHIDSADYRDARVGFATSNSPVGPFEYKGSTRPFGNLSRDIGVFQDPSGIAVLMSEDRDHGLHLYQLTPDYLGIERLLSTTLKADGSHGYESPALVLEDGLYYLFGSDLTGWSANDNKYSTSPSLEGPWSQWRDFAPPMSRTFDSQVSAVVPFPSSEGTTHIYIGDRWIKEDLFHSKTIILPLRLEAGRAELSWRDQWNPSQQK